MRILVRAVVMAGLFAVVVFSVAVVSEALVRAKIDDLPGAPTRYYARPVVFERGDVLDPARLVASLERLGYQRVSGAVGIGEYRSSGTRIVVGRRAYRIYDKLDPGGLTDVLLDRIGRVVSVTDGRGRRLSRAVLEPELIASDFGEEMRDVLPVPLSAIPRQLLDAVLTAEDQRFYGHSGVDFKRVVAAAGANVRAGRIVQGASTITQQLAKNLYLTPERSWIRKARELALAVVLEARYEKDDILETYLNEIYMGQDGSVAIRGMGSAAMFYFAKDVSQLDLAESALLAGIVKGPGLYSPRRNPQLAIERRNTVLRSMGERGIITPEELAGAVDAALGVQPRRPRRTLARYFVARTSQAVRQHTPGSSIYTTLDPRLQAKAELAISSGLEELERRFPRLLGQSTPLQAAMVVLDPHTGEILAMVGGRDFGISQFNRATMAQRQPGSAFKPIVALAALASDHARGSADGDSRFTLASTLQDRPLSVVTPAGLWEPRNYDGQFRGGITLREAIEQSLNVPFARLGMDLGPERIARTARMLGVGSRLVEVPSLALGASEVNLLELTRAYGVLAAGGVLVQTEEVVGTLDATGVPSGAAERTPVARQVFDPAEAFLVTSALQGVVERGTGRAIRGAGYRGAVAGKSGTTNNYRDAWFVGYTPEVAIGVWVGFDDGASIGLSGSGAALPIFARFLVDSFGSGEGTRFGIPRGVHQYATGEPGATTGCRVTEFFIAGTEPRSYCNRRSRPRFDYGRKPRQRLRLGSRAGI